MSAAAVPFSPDRTSFYQLSDPLKRLLNDAILFPPQLKNNHAAAIAHDAKEQE